MIRLRMAGLGALLCLGLILTAGRTGMAAETVSYGQIEALKGLIPQKTAYYEIDATVPVKGPYYQFHVVSADENGEYQVEGIVGLIQLLNEIMVIERFKDIDHGGEVWSGAKDSVKGTLKGAKNIVLHPGDSAKAIGRKIGGVGRTVGKFFAKPFIKTKTSDTGEDRAKQAGNFLYATEAREFAYETGLDVYSHNPHVQALINGVARSRWSGSLLVSVATWYAQPIPIPGFGMVTNGALTSSARIDYVERMIRDNSPDELKYQIKKQYIAHMGLDPKASKPEIDELDRFLRNGNFSPREMAYIAAYIVSMKDVAGREAVLMTLANVNTVDDAIFMYNQMQLLNATHSYGTKLAAYAPHPGRVGAYLPSGDLIEIWIYDVVDETERMRKERAALPKAEKSRNLWLIGDASTAFVNNARNLGITVQEDILHYPAFRRKTEGQAAGDSGELQ